MPNDYYTWAEYVAEVEKLLPIEVNRIGVGATDYLTSLIRQGVIDLQRVIPSFRVNHETLYYPNDLVQEGMAARGVKPPQSSFKSLSISTINVAGDADHEDQVIRAHGEPWPWELRWDLINGNVPSNDGKCRYSIDPQGYTFYVYPWHPNEQWILSMFWDGQKLNFQDDEQVPFTEASALAVSYFVKANTAPEVEDSLQGAALWQSKFEAQKPKLYMDHKALGV